MTGLAPNVTITLGWTEAVSWQSQTLQALIDVPDSDEPSHVSSLFYARQGSENQKNPLPQAGSKGTGNMFQSNHGGIESYLSFPA